MIQKFYPTNYPTDMLQKPLTMYFLRKSHQIYEAPLERLLSPSFWESEEKEPDSKDTNTNMLVGIDHPLGNLLFRYPIGSSRLSCHRALVIYKW
jgi:hypothetical protein